MKNLIIFLVIVAPCFAAEQNCFLWGSSIRQGDRNKMEDQTMNLYPLQNDATKGFFGIFDGHGGKKTSDYAAKNFESAYRMNNTNGEPLYSSLFKDLNDMIYEKAACYNAGTCALVGFINKYHYNLAWVGDSRAVFMSDGQELFETIDHKLKNKREYNRIMKNTGAIYKDTAGIERCCRLVISRALGNEAISEQYDAYKKSIICQPDTCHGVAKPGDLLIFACDGIWDVFKSEEACDFVQAMLQRSKEDLEKLYPEKPISRVSNSPDSVVEEKGDEYLKLIARALRDEAYNKQSGDNLSVQIIQFK